MTVCSCVTADGPCDSPTTRSSGICAYCEAMHQPSDEPDGSPPGARAKRAIEEGTGK